MDVVVTCEFRFSRTPDGNVWTDSVFQQDFWSRYLTVFEKVIVVARIREVEQAQPEWKLSSNGNVEFVALPYYVGLRGLLKHAGTIRKIIKKACTPERAAIFRVPSQSVMLAALPSGKPMRYALEVVGDPLDVFNAGITHSWLDKLFAKLSYQGLKRIAKNALASCYVTERYLQSRYPVKIKHISVGCSDIELHPHHFIDAPRQYQQPAQKLVFVGSLEQMYKGADVLIKAVAELNRKNLRLSVTVLGTGRYLAQLQAMAEEYGCQEQIHFVGAVPHQQVQGYLDSHDLFVMPSLTEGLPRALIEAMARGLPCVASHVGGIPELLSDAFTLMPGDHLALANKLAEVCVSTTHLTQASRDNLIRSRDYQLATLNQRRTDFYSAYRRCLQA